MSRIAPLWSINLSVRYFCLKYVDLYCEEIDYGYGHECRYDHEYDNQI